MIVDIYFAAMQNTGGISMPVYENVVAVCAML